MQDPNQPSDMPPPPYNAVLGASNTVDGPGTTKVVPSAYNSSGPNNTNLASSSDAMRQAKITNLGPTSASNTGDGPDTTKLVPSAYNSSGPNNTNLASSSNAMSGAIITNFGPNNTDLASSSDAMSGAIITNLDPTSAKANFLIAQGDIYYNSATGSSFVCKSHNARPARNSVESATKAYPPLASSFPSASNLSQESNTRSSSGRAYYQSLPSEVQKQARPLWETCVQYYNWFKAAETRVKMMETEVAELRQNLNANVRAHNPIKEVLKNTLQPQVPRMKTQPKNPKIGTNQKTRKSGNHRDRAENLEKIIEYPLPPPLTNQQIIDGHLWTPTNQGDTHALPTAAPQQIQNDAHPIGETPSVQRVQNYWDQAVPQPLNDLPSVTAAWVPTQQSTYIDLTEVDEQPVAEPFTNQNNNQATAFNPATIRRQVDKTTASQKGSKRGIQAVSDHIQVYGILDVDHSLKRTRGPEDDEPVKKRKPSSDYPWMQGPGKPNTPFGCPEEIRQLGESHARQVREEMKTQWSKKTTKVGPKISDVAEKPPSVRGKKAKPPTASSKRPSELLTGVQQVSTQGSDTFPLTSSSPDRSLAVEVQEESHNSGWTDETSAAFDAELEAELAKADADGVTNCQSAQAARDDYNILFGGGLGGVHSDEDESQHQPWQLIIEDPDNLEKPGRGLPSSEGASTEKAPAKKRGRPKKADAVGTAAEKPPKKDATQRKPRKMNVQEAKPREKGSKETPAPAEVLASRDAVQDETPEELPEVVGKDVEDPRAEHDKVRGVNIPKGGLIAKGWSGERPHNWGQMDESRQYDWVRANRPDDCTSSEEE